MTTTTSINTSDAARNRATSRPVGAETKASFKTTEFLAYVLSVIGVLVALQLVGSDTSAGDVLRADRAWMLVTALTIGYMISRGLAKSGSRDYHFDDK